MESYAASSEDQLIDGLSFKLGNSASYITDRKSVTFWPSGSNVYKTTSGTKVIKFQLNSEGWCDPSTVRIMFNLVNNGDAVERLRPLQGAYSFFRRLRISAGGALVEDFEYSRKHGICRMMKLSDIGEHDAIEEFEYREGAIDNPTTANMAGIKGDGNKNSMRYAFEWFASMW